MRHTYMRAHTHIHIIYTLYTLRRVGVVQVKHKDMAKRENLTNYFNLVHA